MVSGFTMEMMESRSMDTVLALLKLHQPTTTAHAEDDPDHGMG